MRKSRRTKQKPLRVKSKDSLSRVRRAWIRHPGEKIVGNRRERRPTSRELKEEALDEQGDIE